MKIKTNEYLNEIKEIKGIFKDQKPLDLLKKIDVF